MTAWFTSLGLVGKLVAVALALAVLIGAGYLVLHEFGTFETRAAAGGAAQADAKNTKAELDSTKAAVADQTKRQAAGDQVEAGALAGQAAVRDNFKPIEQEAIDYAKSHPVSQARPVAKATAAAIVPDAAGKPAVPSDGDPLIFLSTLAGCASGTLPTTGALTVKPGAQVMAKPLPPPQDLPEGSGKGAMLLNHVQGMKALWSCVGLDQAKADFINKTLPK